MRIRCLQPSGNLLPTQVPSSEPRAAVAPAWRLALVSESISRSNRVTFLTPDRRYRVKVSLDECADIFDMRVIFMDISTGQGGLSYSVARPRA